MEEIQRHEFFNGVDFEKLLIKEVPSPFGSDTGDKEDVIPMDVNFRSPKQETSLHSLLKGEEIRY